MPLPLPSLDDRTWTDLTAEGTALIPRYAPNWTNWNASDPGITLVELFAWLTEMTIYRLDRISPAHQRKFIELLGFDIWLPEAASTLLSFTPASSTYPFELPAGIQFQAVTGDGTVVPFRTRRDVDVAPVVLRAIQVDTGDGNLKDLTGQWNDRSDIAGFGLNPQAGAALYLGFDELFSQIPLALGFRFTDPGNDRRERQRISKEWAAQQTACVAYSPSFGCDDGSGASDGVLPAGVEILPPYHSAKVAWEVFTLAPSNWWKLQPVSAPGRPYPGEVMDDTRSLTLDGIVEVNLPPALTKAVLGQVPMPLFYIRCRLDSGSWDAPPMLIDVSPNSVLSEQAVPVWQAYPIASGVTPGGLTPTPGSSISFVMQLDGMETVQAFDVLAPNARTGPEATVLAYEAPTASANGLVVLGIIFAGFGSGLPDQVLMLPSPPVRRGSFQIFTLTNGAWQEWTLRPDFGASARTDFHAVLDYTGGTVSLGNGERGQVAMAGALVFCKYLATEAESGNVVAASINQLANSPWNTLLLAGLDPSTQQQLSLMVSNRGAASAGAAQETLVHATGRAVETLFAHERLLELCETNNVSTLDRIEHSSVIALQAPFRGVNLIDIERLALNVPGTKVARARAWSSLDPNYPCLEATGVVTVAVLPDTPTAQPQPSAGLLHAISAYLERRRIVCTRIEVVGPSYMTVSVQANVKTLANSNLLLIQGHIISALNLFLDPRLGGVDGLGWPFGRNVMRSEIMRVICEIAGVDYVTSLSLTADSGEPRCGNLALCGMSLATPGSHEIEVS